MAFFRLFTIPSTLLGITFTLYKEQATSVMSIAAFCRGKQIKPQQFHCWRRRFREQPCAGGFLQLIPDRALETGSGIRIHPGKKLIIEVERGFDSFILRAVVETLSLMFDSIIIESLNQNQDAQGSTLETEVVKTRKPSHHHGRVPIPPCRRKENLLPASFVRQCPTIPSPDAKPMWD